MMRGGDVMDADIRQILKLKYDTEDGEVVHVQKRLNGVYPSPVEIVFKAEYLWSSGELSLEQLSDALWRRFPLYNLDDEKMLELIVHMGGILEKKSRIIIPRQLLSLAVLNVVDSRLNKDNMSRYFKSKYLELSMGRRSYASRFLRENGYIEERGNVWMRTQKKFNQEDFWIEHID